MGKFITTTRKVGLIRIQMLVSFLVLIGVAIVIVIITSRGISKELNNDVDKLNSTSTELERTSKRVYSSGKEVTNNTSTIAASVEEITASLEELQAIIETNTKNINAGKIMMDKANSSASENVKLMDDLQGSIIEIDESSRKVAKVIKVIDDIAFQTNILALNAAVEAARAGDAGRGFAVVAEQVKNLAQKSADAARETANLIESALESVDHGRNKGVLVQDNSRTGGETMKQVSQIMNEINRGSQEQLKGANQVNKAINEINNVVQHSAAISNENAISASELISHANEVKEAVESLIQLANGVKAGTQIVKSKDELSTDTLEITAKNNDDEDVEIIRAEDTIPLGSSKPINNDFDNF